MARIYHNVEADPEALNRLIELFSAALPAMAQKLYEHTIGFQIGGCLTGANDTPELRAKLSGVNRSNTVVECVFALNFYQHVRGARCCAAAKVGLFSGITIRPCGASG